MSHARPGRPGRGNPRSSTEPAAWQPRGFPAPIAGLPATSASVWGGPPAVGTMLELTASADRPGGPPIRSSVPAPRPHVLGEASSKLCPSDVTLPVQLAPPPVGVASIVFSTVVPPSGVLALTLAPTSAALPATVSFR